MCAQHQQSLIVSSYQKGIRDFNTNQAWEAIWHDLTTPGVELAGGGFAGDRHLAAYLKFGYVPDEVGLVSSTMEYPTSIGPPRNLGWLWARLMRRRNC